MPRKRLPPRLWLEPERRNAAGALTHGGWVIRDGSKKVGTGCGALDHSGATKALERYLTSLHASASLPKGQSAADVLIDDVLRHYADVKGTAIAKPEELARRLETLLGFWAGKTLDEIDSRSCKRYVDHRGDKVGSARRELEDLRAAVGLAIEDKICREAVKVKLPPKPKARTHYLTRDAAARLIWHAYRKKEQQKISRGPRKGETVETSKRPTRHIARFILFGLYTGSRARRVWMASFYRMEGHPFIDVENGVFYREAPEETASRTKQAPPIRIPDRLIVHLRRWKAEGCRFLCEYRAGRPGDPKKGFRHLVDEVLGEEGSEIVRHSLRHTAASWLMQANEDAHAVAGYLGMKTDTLIKVYAHHDPEYQRAIGDAFSKGRAGRGPDARKRSRPKLVRTANGGVPPTVSDRNDGNEA